MITGIGIWTMYALRDTMACKRTFISHKKKQLQFHPIKLYVAWCLMKRNEMNGLYATFVHMLGQGNI